MLTETGNKLYAKVLDILIKTDSKLPKFSEFQAMSNARKQAAAMAGQVGSRRGVELPKNRDLAN